MLEQNLEVHPNNPEHLALYEHSVTPLSSALSEGEANSVGDHSNHVQNRMNQRAHRLRIKKQDPGSIQTSRPFQVRRWRVDEPDNCPSQDASSASKGATATTLIFTPERTGVLRGPRPTAPVHAQTSLTPPVLHLPPLNRSPPPSYPELLQDLISELISTTPARKRRSTPLAITVSDPKTMWTLPPTARRDEDE
ncbi:hypothetical protein DL95DRAFT_428777 [Leptodontidium sp. 2 PMI_412]|nr:hypothetical protein DL95DRAFT_428777 [Leptodontidium sp. 2 PMI_412]